MHVHAQQRLAHRGGWGGGAREAGGEELMGGGRGCMAVQQVLLKADTSDASS